MTKNLLRQGDVLLRRASISLPSDATTVQDKILARGETTGHSHRIEGQARVVRSGNGQLLVQVDGEAALVHEEHGRIDLEPGIYEVVGQREYDPVAERAVSD